MLRALLLATLFLTVPRASAGQVFSVLHIRAVLLDPEGKPVPVPRHALLVSDNPASAPPRLILTALDGTANVKLRPGNYTVESDRPVAFHGKMYEWMQFVDVIAGHDTVLELTAANAESKPVLPTATSAGAMDSDPLFLLQRWQDSIVELWTPTTHASGFLVDARGLVATSQQVIGSATSVEVQLTPDLKVAARVLATDPARDVAVLWIDPAAAASLRPVPLECAGTAKPTVTGGQEIFTIGIPLRGPRGMTSGRVNRVARDAFFSDLMLAPGSAGGPVFTADGRVAGITSIVPDAERDGTQVRTVPLESACAVVASAETKMKGAAAPPGTPLPTEPSRPFPVAALADAVKRRAGNLHPYSISSSTFDIAFMTPVHTYAAQRPPSPEPLRDPGRSTRGGVAEQALARHLFDFGDWSEYLADSPPVLLVRVTPKFVEGFWTTVARGAARTQGVSLPPIKRFKPGFSRMRAYCGAAEVVPIHPFRLELPLTEKDTLREGLYVFDPGAFGPQCGTVRLVLYSEKEPDKADSTVVDPGVVQQIWQDFVPYRVSTR